MYLLNVPTDICTRLICILKSLARYCKIFAGKGFIQCFCKSLFHAWLKCFGLNLLTFCEDASCTSEDRG